MLQLLNFTKMVAGFTNGLRPDAREVLVVVIKGTFQIPQDGGEPALSDNQVELIDADVFSGEPGFSAPVYEIDYPPIKPHCDVLLNGSAYSPEGRPAQRVPVALRVGKMAKTFNVVGSRVWTRGMTAISPTEPEFFVKMPIGYDNAFGGIDTTDPDKPRYFPQNHAGKGFSHNMNLDTLIGQPLPNTEEIDNPVTNPRGSYRPMSFGTVGRSWHPRAKFAGTYDQNWVDNVCPFLPSDFADDYYQAAPQDQQIPYLQGGEEVSLLNLTPSGKQSFRLPKLEIPVAVHLRDPQKNESDELGTALPVSLDTLLIEPDLYRFTCCWRAHWPLRQNMHEIDSVVVGKVPRAVEMSWESLKPYYRSLGEYSRAMSESVE